MTHRRALADQRTIYSQYIFIALFLFFRFYLHLVFCLEAYAGQEEEEEEEEEEGFLAPPWDPSDGECVAGLRFTLPAYEANQLLA